MPYIRTKPIVLKKIGDYGIVGFCECWPGYNRYYIGISGYPEGNYRYIDVNSKTSRDVIDKEIFKLVFECEQIIERTISGEFILKTFVG
jgi:hypothetical protein